MSWLSKEELSELFAELNKSGHRNAGALFGYLCGDYPTVEDQLGNDIPYSDWRLVFWFDN
jgi:hypothetical protein